MAEEGLFEGYGDGGFAGGGQPGEPDCEAVLAAEGLADGGGDGAGVVGDVADGGLVLRFGVRDDDLKMQMLIR